MHMKSGFVTGTFLAVTLLGLVAGVATAQTTADNGTQTGSLSGNVKPFTAQPAKPVAGSFSTGKPAAGSLTIGKPTAGSMVGGKPSAGSLAVGVSAGSLSSPAGTTERISGTQLRRLESTDDGTTYTRKPRERHRRRY